MSTELTELTGHYIVCGACGVGHSVIEAIKKNQIPFVVIDKDERIIQQLIDEGVSAIQGDATTEENLKNARIIEAKGLFACLPSDSDNAYLIITARMINSQLYIISKANSKGSNNKLINAGANDVVSSSEIAGIQMAFLANKPFVSVFLEQVEKEKGLCFKQLTVHSSSSLIGEDVNELKSSGVNIIAKKNFDSDQYDYNPSDTVIKKGDKVIVWGRSEEINNL